MGSGITGLFKGGQDFVPQARLDAYRDRFQKLQSEVGNTQEGMNLLDIGLGGTGSGAKAKSILTWETGALTGQEWDVASGNLFNAYNILEAQKEIRKENRATTQKMAAQNYSPDVIAAFKSAGERNSDTEISKYLK